MWACLGSQNRYRGWRKMEKWKMALRTHAWVFERIMPLREVTQRDDVIQNASCPPNSILTFLSIGIVTGHIAAQLL